MSAEIHNLFSDVVESINLVKAHSLNMASV